MKYMVIFVQFFMVCVSYVSAQPNPDTLWTRTCGESGNDWPYGGIVETTDGGYVVAGSLNLSTDSLTGYVVKIGSNGDSVWTRRFPDVGFYSIINASGGGFVLAGGSGSWTAHTSDAFTARIDEDGQTLWTTTFGGTDSDRLVCISERSDGHFVVGGYSLSFSGDANQDYYLAVVSSAGDTMWTRSWGGINSDAIADIVRLPDEKLVLGGWTRSSGSGEADYSLQELDSSGTVIWSHTYGTYLNEIARSLCLTGDGGFMLMGAYAEPSSSLPTAFALRTNQDGDSLWSRAFGFQFQSTTSYEILRVGDEDAYVFCGNYAIGPEINAWLVRFNSVGDTVWTRSFGPTGPNNVESALGMERTSSGGYVLSGIFWDLSGSSGTDFYVIKTGVDMLEANPAFDPIPSSFDASVYPNPLNSQATLTLYLPKAERVEVVMYDVLGRAERTIADEVMAAGERRMLVNGEGLSSGIYFVRVQAGERRAIQKIMLLK